MSVLLGHRKSGKLQFDESAIGMDLWIFACKHFYIKILAGFKLQFAEHH